MVRFLLGLFSALLLLGGVGGGIVYPALMANAEGSELTRGLAFERTAGSRPVDMSLTAPNRPLLVKLEIRLDAPIVVGSGGALLTVTGSADGKTLLATTVNVADIKTRLVDPQSAELDATVLVGTIENPPAGIYTFSVGPGDSETENVVRAELVVVEGPLAASTQAQPIGMVAMAIGFIGFVLSLRRRAPTNPNSQAPAPKWGRNSQ